MTAHTESEHRGSCRYNYAEAVCTCRQEPPVTAVPPSGPAGAPDAGICPACGGAWSCSRDDCPNVLPAVVPASVPPSVQELGDRLRSAIEVSADQNAIYRDNLLAALDRLVEIAGERDAALAAQAELQEELEEERTPPNGWGPAQEAWHQFHLDQTAAAEARAVAAEKGEWQAREALIRCAELAGEDGEAVEAARSGSMTFPSIPKFAIDAVSQLRADCEELVHTGRGKEAPSEPSTGDGSRDAGRDRRRQGDRPELADSGCVRDPRPTRPAPEGGTGDSVGGHRGAVANDGPLLGVTVKINSLHEALEAAEKERDAAREHRDDLKVSLAENVRLRDTYLDERDVARAQVAALTKALSDLLADDDMPNHWEDCVCSYCTKNRAARAALAGVLGPEAGL